MSARRQLALALVMLALSACHVGPQVEQTDVGRKPYGADVVVQLKEKANSKRVEHSGELLEVRSDGLVVLAGKDAEDEARIIFVPWSRIYRAAANDLPGIAVRTSQGESQQEASTADLRNVSRFPQGLSPELTNQLLAHYGQSAIQKVD